MMSTQSYSMTTLAHRTQIIKRMSRHGMACFVTLRRTRHVRSFYQSKRISKAAPAKPSASTGTGQRAEITALSSFNLFHQIRDAKPAVRYTVYAGIGLMATVESAFWISVLKAKFLPSASKEEQQRANQLLVDIKGAVKGYRKVWMSNYGRYYSAYAWGLGYGGLDGLDN